MIDRSPFIHYRWMVRRVQSVICCSPWRKPTKRAGVNCTTPTMQTSEEEILPCSPAGVLLSLSLSLSHTHTHTHTHTQLPPLSHTTPVVKKPYSASGWGRCEGSTRTAMAVLPLGPRNFLNQGEVYIAPTTAAVEPTPVNTKPFKPASAASCIQLLILASCWALRATEAAASSARDGPGDLSILRPSTETPTCQPVETCLCRTNVSLDAAIGRPSYQWCDKLVQSNRGSSLSSDVMLVMLYLPIVA